MNLDGQLCYCFHITKRKIVNFVKRTRPKRASQISECFGAGTGCGWCIPFLRRIHRQVVAGDIVESDDISPSEYEAMRATYRREVREGTRARNTHDTTGEPAEPGDRLDDGSWRRTMTGDRGDPDLPYETPEKDAGWDVSDYFSRPRPAEPEPDTLE